MPVAVVGDGDNALVTWDAEQVGRAIVRGPNGYAVDRVFNGSNAAEHTEAETAFLEQEREEWGVMLDGVDYSAPYAQCLRSSDYVEPGAAADPGQELRDKQKIAEASNEWAACARNNGWPDLADAQPGNADGYATVPTVLLPATITVQELEALLEHCPAAVPDGDPDQWSPSIDFDADTPEPESGDGGDTTEDGSEHLQQLRDVLYAATHPEE
jgi:hypothetical protein